MIIPISLYIILFLATNILRVNGRELKLIDLDGCTRYMSDGQESTALVGVLGDGPIKFSSGYMPPEYIQNHIADLKLLKKKLKDRRYLWKRKKEKEKSVAPENEASPVSVKGNDTTNTNSTNNTSDETPSKATTNRSGSIFSTKPKDSKRDILEENSEVLSDGGSKSGSRWRKFRNSVSAFTHLPLRDSTRSSIEGKSDHDSAKVLSEIDSNNNSKRDVNIGIDSSEMQSTTYTILPIDEGTKEALASDRSSEMKDAEASEKAPTPADNIGSNNQSKLSINIIESKSADDYEANPSTAIRRRSRGEENNRDVLRASRESRDSLHSQSDASRTAQRYRMLKSSSINTITGIILSRVSSSSIKVASMKLPKESPRFGYLNIANNNEDEANDDMDGDDDSNENDDELEDKNEELMANMNRDDTFNATVVSPAQDMWSFGVLLYHIVVNAPLFLEDNDGNVIQKSDLEALLEWKDDTKLLKLSAVKDLYARNLISLLLTKDPSKRLTMAKVLAHPFLNPGMRPARLEGDPPEYDVFISYRVLTDSDLAEALYNELTSHGLTVFWDKKCLQDGELWEDGFCRGIVKSRIFLPIFSKDAMRNQVLPRLNWENFQPSSSVDNVLLEHRLAIEMMSRGLLEKIYPVFAGPTRTSTVLSPTSESSSKKENIVFEKYNFTDTMDGESCFPACADIVVHDIEAKFADHLDRQGLGLTLSGERLSVKTIVTKISQYQGKALEGPIDGEVKKVVDSVFTMCSSASPPFSRPVLDSFSSFSMPSFNNFGSPSSINLLNRKDAFKAILDNFTSYLESLNTSPDIIALMRERHELLYETEDAGTFLNHFSSLYGTNLADSIPSLGVAQPTD